MKAKYIGKYVDKSYGQHMVYLEYEYRGKRYTVYENLNKGNIPLAWQHSNEQGRIDTIIEMESKPKKPIDPDYDIWKEFCEMMELWENEKED